MSQVVLEFSNQNDAEPQMVLMKLAANDPLFLADVQETMDEFAHADLENIGHVYEILQVS